MAIFGSIKRYFHSVGDNNRKRFKKMVLAAPFWVILISVGMLTYGIIKNVTEIGNRYDQGMASYWTQDGDMSYRQLSVFARGARSGGDKTPMAYISPEQSLKRADILMTRTSLQGIVDSGNTGKKDKGLDKDGRPVGWEDCFSSTVVGEVATYTGTSDTENSLSVNVDAELVAVDGNFKAFHPFEFLSGGFLPENCVDINQIVLNDVIAWRFYNSYDVVGNQITLWGKVFTVIGVVSEPTSSVDRAVGVDNPRAYIYFSALENYCPLSADSEVTGDYAIECYEAMLPEMVNNVSVNDLKTSLPSYTDSNPQMVVISNTGRFGMFKVIDWMVPIGETSQTMAQYELPYWEKAAQLTTEHLFVNIIVIAAGAVLLFIGIIMVVLKLRKFTNENK